MFLVLFFALGTLSVVIITQRLFLSPLSHIPGPKLAALTYYYQSYYELFPHRGQFLFKCEELHKKYGPVIRIGPDEVHINDPWYWEETYPPPSRRRHKSPLFYWMGGMGSFGDQGMFTTLDHDHHRIRRSALGTYFSKQKVRELEPRLREKVLLLRQRLLERGSANAINLKDAFSALTLGKLRLFGEFCDCKESTDTDRYHPGLSDVISTYCFGNSLKALDRPDLGKEWSDMTHFAIKMNPFGRTFPFISRRMLTIPQWMMKWSQNLLGANEFLDTMFRLTQNAMDEALSDEKDFRGAVDPKQRTVIHSMVQNEGLPEHEKTFTRLANDSLVLVAAGYTSTSTTLAITTYHILTKPHVHARVLEELRTIMHTPESEVPPLAQLERLPYLTAVILEGTRLGHGAAGRHSRIAPDEDLQYISRDGKHQYRIPRGTTFSQSIYLAHMNDELYPQPSEFDPDRYFRIHGEVTEAQRHLVAFGKGARQCPGINLAYAELYLSIATLIGSVDMEIAEPTTERDVTIASEFFVGLLPEDGPGILTRVNGWLQKSTDLEKK